MILLPVALVLLGVIWAYFTAMENGWQAGFRPRLGSFWIGFHWSPFSRRLCINLVPCLTVWVCFKDGIRPDFGSADVVPIRRQK